MKLLGVAAVVTVCLVAVGCGSTETTRALAAVPAAGDVAPASAAAPSTSAADPLEGTRAGQSVMVGDTRDSSRYGWVAWDDMYAATPQEASRIVPVVDDSGQTIAYWAQGVGWITSDEADAAGFNYDRLLDAEKRRDTGAT